MKRISILLLVFFVFGALSAGCAKSPSQPTPTPAATPGETAPAPETTPQPSATSQGTTPGAVILYFANADASAVVPEARTLDIPNGISKDDYVKFLVEELIKGPQSADLHATIPATVKVLDAHVEDTAAYLDFSQEMLTDHSRGAAGEAMTVYSIVSTLTELEGIDGVMMTVAGTPMNIEHMVIESPVPRDESMIQQ
jgi:germination protein M